MKCAQTERTKIVPNARVLEILPQLFVCPNNELPALHYFLYYTASFERKAKSEYSVIVALNSLVFQKLERKSLAVAFCCYNFLLVVISEFSLPYVLSCLRPQDVLGEFECQFYLWVFI